jgi:hypothetical protein
MWLGVSPLQLSVFFPMLNVLTVTCLGEVLLWSCQFGVLKESRTWIIIIVSRFGNCWYYFIKNVFLPSACTFSSSMPIICRFRLLKVPGGLARSICTSHSSMLLSLRSFTSCLLETTAGCKELCILWTKQVLSCCTGPAVCAPRDSLGIFPQSSNLAGGTNSTLSYALGWMTETASLIAFRACPMVYHAMEGRRLGEVFWSWVCVQNSQPCLQQAVPGAQALC